MKKLKLSDPQIIILVNTFDAHKGFIQRALNLTQVNCVRYNSKATTRKEAIIEYYHAEDGSKEQKAAVRKIIEFSVTEAEAIEAFFLANLNHHKDLAIRKFAEIRFGVGVKS